LRFAVTLSVALVVAAPASAWPGRPVAPPPKPAQPGGPPPAWAESATRAIWLTYGSYCWHTTCADYLPPAARPDLATLKLTSGAVVRIHLGFTPRQLSIRRLPSGAAVPLRPASVTSWRMRATGVYVLDVRGAGGSASYAVRVLPP
jgi:hypothetical protein